MQESMHTTRTIGETVETFYNMFLGGSKWFFL